MELHNDMVSTVRTDKKLEQETEPIKLKCLTDSDDIESYCTTCKQMMQAYKMDESNWALRFAPELTGLALQTYSSMDPSDAECYNSMKSPILCRFNTNINEKHLSANSLRISCILHQCACVEIGHASHL